MWLNVCLFTTLHSKRQIVPSIFESSMILAVEITFNLCWALKTQERLHLRCRLDRANTFPSHPCHLLQRYNGEHPDQLFQSISGMRTATVSECKTLQRFQRTDETIIAVSLPIFETSYTNHCIQKATSIVNSPSHPTHRLCHLAGVTATSLLPPLPLPDSATDSFKRQIKFSTQCGFLTLTDQTLWPQPSKGGE